MLGNQIANRSPFVRPRETSPAASWSTWKRIGIMYVCTGFLRLQRCLLKDRYLRRGAPAVRSGVRASHAPRVCAKRIFHVSFPVSLRFHPRSRPFVRGHLGQGRASSRWPCHGRPKKRLHRRLLILDPRPLFTLVFFSLRGGFVVLWKPLLHFAFVL